MNEYKSRFQYAIQNTNNFIKESWKTPGEGPGLAMLLACGYPVIFAGAYWASFTLLKKEGDKYVKDIPPL